MRSAFLQLHMAVFLAGVTGVLGKLISLNEALLVWYRLLLTVIALWCIFLALKKVKRIAFREMVRLTGIGGLVAMHWVAFYGSIKFSNVSISLVCLSLIGFFSSILEPLMLKTKFAIQEVLLGLISVAGVSLVFHFDLHYRTGLVFGIISALFASLFTILNKQALTTHDPINLTVYELTGGALVMTLILPLYLAAFSVPFAVPTAMDWIWLLFLALACTVLAYILQLNALVKISSFTVNLTYNLEPFYGILLAFFLFHENKDLSSGFYYGFALIMLAVLLQMLRVYRTHRSATRLHLE
jgi:drug/metabolite transporter (DMT)-like permease